MKIPDKYPILRLKIIELGYDNIYKYFSTNVFSNKGIIFSSLDIKSPMQKTGIT
jgi:hypothetical protein